MVERGGRGGEGMEEGRRERGGDGGRKRGEGRKGRILPVRDGGWGGGAIFARRGRIEG